MKEFSGNLNGTGRRIGIVVAKFNDFITSRLVAGCRDELLKCGISDENIDCVWVPGSFEIPVAAKTMIDRGYDGIICLGAVIKGDTPHFEYISSTLARAINSISVESHIPVVFGVITAETLEQAIERAGTKAGNRGADAARACLEMIDLLGKI